MAVQIYEQVTNQIIADLESGTVPWLRPWKSNPHSIGIMPTNAATGRSYSGINIPILWGSASRNKYQKHAWLTYKQAQEKGGQVRKGEKSTMVVFTKKMTRGEDDDKKTFSMLKQYFVFNTAQVDGLPEAPIIERPEIERHQGVEAFIKATDARFRFGGDRACYIPTADFINMPEIWQFKTVENFYSVELHELTHWSAHETRLNRDLKGRFGTKAYAAEELVAELGAAFLCAHLNIKGELRHAGYIANWIQLLKEDQRAIFTAASKASAAADYLRTFYEKVEKEAA